MNGGFWACVLNRGKVLFPASAGFGALIIGISGAAVFTFFGKAHEDAPYLGLSLKYEELFQKVGSFWDLIDQINLDAESISTSQKQCYESQLQDTYIFHFQTTKKDC